MATNQLDLGLRVASLALVLALAHGASAQNRVLATPDVTATLGTAVSATVDDDDIAVDNGAGVVNPALAPVVAALPLNVELAAMDRDLAGNWLIVPDITTPLPGLAATAPATPRSVLRYRPATADFVLVLDVSAAVAGFPSNARIDALAVASDGDLLLSFDTSVSIPGAPCNDEDVVRYDAGTNSWSLSYDGSANGIAEGLDVDAATRDVATGRLLFSFDGGGVAGGVSFDDEDVLSFDSGAGTYAKYFDGSTSDPTDWPPTDLVALPEPAVLVQLCAGAMALAALARPRSRSPRLRGRTSARTP